MLGRPKDWLESLAAGLRSLAVRPLGRMSIRSKLLIAIALISVPPLLVSLIGDLQGLAQLQADIRTANTSLATTTGEIVDSSIDQAIAVAWAIADGVASQPMTPAVLDRKLQALASAYPQFINIVVVDAAGNSVGEMLPYPTGQPRVNLSNSAYVRQALDTNAAVVSPIQTNTRTGRPEVVAAVPVRNGQGQPIGAVGVALNLAYLQMRLGAAAPSHGLAVVVADPRGQVATVNGTVPSGHLPSSIADVPLVHQAMTTGAGFQSSGPFDDLPGSWYGVSQQSPRYHWIATVVQPAGQATAPIMNAIAVDLLAFVAAVVLAVAGSIFVSRQILNPIGALKRAAEAWSRGNFGQRVDIRSGDEFETLGTTFNDMAASLGNTLAELRNTERQLEVERNRLRAIVDTSPAGIVVVDRDGRLVTINPAARTLLGLGAESDPASLQDLATKHLYRPDGERFQVSEVPIVRSLREGATIGSVEVLVRRPNGWEAHLIVNSAPFRSTSGAILGAVAVFIDISPLAEEERLRAEFVTSAAHEFRNPLTVIRGYAEVAMRDPSVQNSSVRSELERILAAAARVERLADELMRAAQLHLPALILRMEVVDLAALVRSTVATYQAAEKSARRELVISQRPAYVNGDPGLLREALTYLLRQAAAVTPADQPIEVSVTAWDGIATVAVRDHGPLVSSEELDTLFVPFIVSAGPSSPGLSGRPVLLLYLARRIVEESGGWMRATSGPNGTVISFTLPRLRREAVTATPSEPTPASDGAIVDGKPAESQAPRSP